MRKAAEVVATIASLFVLESGLRAQGPPGDAVGVLVEVRGHVQRLDRHHPGGARTITAAEDVEVESPGLTLKCSRADVEIEGNVLS